MCVILHRIKLFDLQIDTPKTMTNRVFLPEKSFMVFCSQIFTNENELGLIAVQYYRENCVLCCGQGNARNLY